MKAYDFALEQTDPVAVFDTVHDRPYALFLDSADKTHPDAQKSFIFFDPIKTHTSNLDDLEQGEYYAAGYFGYDLARTLENLPQNTIKGSASLMAVGLYDFSLCFNHKTSKATLTIYADTLANAERREEEILKQINPQNSKHHAQPALTQPNWHSDKTSEAYESDVQTIINYILQGDVFQANLSQRFSTILPEDFCAWHHYKQLRTVSPAPFAAFMNCGDTKIASASPERFLTIQNNKVITRPIKGTLPRSMPGKILEESKKDRAENIMIVDLLRNDLSKVCEPQSIEVTELCKLETFTNVHHLVSTITGLLKEKKSAIDLLKACFPGGSITGAPKIRAMEIIEELETHARGPYCGALGYITPDGNMDTNIMIRTLVYEGGTAYFNVGGGITASSDPAAEYQETLDKAQGIFESFEHKEKIQAAE